VKDRTQELETTLAELSNYLYRSSHDLRRPLTTVIGLSKLYYAGQVDQSSIVDMMHKTVYVLDRMLKKMQMAYDLEEGGGKRETFDVPKLIKRIVKELLSDAETRIIQLNLEAPRRYLHPSIATDGGNRSLQSD
jgi:Signal transduction histidine kinase